MLIRNDIEHMPIKEELEHIVLLLNRIIKKIGCNTLFLYNTDTLEDNAFLQIYKNNEEKIKANLVYIGYQGDLEGQKISYIGDNIDLLLEYCKKILLTNEVAIINTDTEFLARANEDKINYNIEVFKDYSTEYLQKIIEFYNAQATFEQSRNKITNEKSQIILKDYILGNKINEKYTNEEIRDFIKSLPKRITKNCTIFNTITSNYVVGINSDLEQLIKDNKN